MTHSAQPDSNANELLDLQIGAVSTQLTIVENILQTLQIQLLSNIDDVYEERVDKKIVEKMLKVPVRKQVGRLKVVSTCLKEIHNKLSLLRKESDTSVTSEA